MVMLVPNSRPSTPSKQMASVGTVHLVSTNQTFDSYPSDTIRKLSTVVFSITEITVPSTIYTPRTPL